uniref:Uncharacterized protein n=1 Tax=Arundo donax TaxID=35708 RepID=A0A0A8YHJ0_ARUDO
MYSKFVVHLCDSVTVSLNELRSKLALCRVALLNVPDWIELNFFCVMDFYCSKQRYKCF